VFKLVVNVQPIGGSAADLAGNVDYTTAVDVADLESVMSGASEVSWSSYINWEEVDRFVAEFD